MAVEILTHSHAVIDDDRHFLIDPDTKQITPAQSDVKIAQHSKNSERLTFEIPSVTVEGHDMTKCNQVAIHFRNVDARTGQESIGIYMVPADDIVTDGANEVTVSWLVDDDATVYAGGLVFSIHFICTEEGKVVYDFPTLTYTGLIVGETVWNSEVIARKYPDVIANHEARITALEKNGGSGEAPTVTNVTVTDHGDGRFTQVKEFSDGSEEVTEVTVDENGIPIRLTVNGVEIPYFFRYGGDDPGIPDEPVIPDDPVIPEEPDNYLYRTRAASEWSYNGIVYPVIEGQWQDKETYPYAFIYRYSSTMGNRSYLVLCQTAPYYDSAKNAVCVEGQYSCYHSSNGKYWSETTHDADFDITSAWGIQWTSENILYKDSTDIYLEGSEPVLTFTDAEYFIDGIGYKDRVLPKRPNWDKEKYSNAVMTWYETLSYQPLAVYFLANPTMGWTTLGDVSPYFLRYDVGDMKYEAKRTDPADDYPAFGEGTVLEDSKTFFFDNIIWSGTDLYDPAGNLYIHGSEPIPVYE